MKVTSISRATHTMLAAEIVEALSAIGDKYGIKFSAGGGQYGVDSHFKVKAEVLDTGTGMSSAEVIFRQHAPYHGIDPDAFGKTFKNGTKVYTVTGWRPSASVYPILAESGGKTLCFTPDALVHKYPKSKAA